MSLSSTATLKGQLIKNLGSNARQYFDALSHFISGRTSRAEFEQVTKNVLTSANLCGSFLAQVPDKLSIQNSVQLHNAMIISLFDATATLKRPPSPPPPTLTKRPPTKRRRTLLPYQGPNFSDQDRTIRSARMKRWALTLGRKERERLKTMQNLPSGVDPPRPRKDMDEIACERGVELLTERGGLVFSVSFYIWAYV